MPNERLDDDNLMNDQNDAYQQWIDGLLCDPDAQPALPNQLRTEVATAFARKRRRSHLRNWAIAASLLAVICWPRAAPQPQTNIPPTPVATNLPVAKTTPPPIATFTPSDDMIAIVQPSPAANVTVVKVYPTTVAQRRWRREALLKPTALLNTNGG